ncbi:transposase family protein [Streptomyces sp. NPDC088194]|uniref:transposase family protein n=1 Tax=Streptomyces sp. NPDC088194 TaxID=3154931 RepID=UPI00344D31B1
MATLTRGACPHDGVRSGWPHRWVRTRPRDLPVAGRRTCVTWTKRRWRCVNSGAGARRSPRRCRRSHRGRGRRRGRVPRSGKRSPTEDGLRCGPRAAWRCRGRWRTPRSRPRPRPCRPRTRRR